MIPGRHEWRPYRQMGLRIHIAETTPGRHEWRPYRPEPHSRGAFHRFRRVRLQAHRFMTGTDLLRGRFHHRITGFMLRQVLLNNIKIQSQL